MTALQINEAVERLFILESFKSVDVLCLRDDPSTVNISDEMTKTSFGNVWKSLTSDGSKKDQSSKRFGF